MSSPKRTSLHTTTRNTLLSSALNLTHQIFYERWAMTAPLDEPHATHKFRRDLRWSLAALGLTGACGLALNTLIGVTYGKEALGVFNQVFAAYILLSQLAVLGVHFSTLKHLSESVETGAALRRWSGPPSSP